MTDELLQRLAVIGRDDVFFMTALARNLLTGAPIIDTTPTHIYHEFLSKLNPSLESVSRERPLKTSVDAFRCSADAVRGIGTDRRPSQAFVDIPGSRVSIEEEHALALVVAAHQIGIDLREEIHPLLGSGLLDALGRSFGSSAQLGVDPAALAFAVAEKMAFHRRPHVPLLIIWPRAQTWETEILQAVRSRWPTCRFALRVKLDENVLISTIAMAYRDAEWAHPIGGVEKKNREVTDGRTISGGLVTLVPLEPTDDNEVRAFKDQVRGFWGHRFMGIHTTDSRQESLRLWTSLSEERALSALHAIPAQTLMAQQQRLRPLADDVYASTLGPLGLVVSGSQWLDIFGIRPSRDVDVVHEHEAHLPSGVSSHNSYLQRFGFALPQLLHSGAHYVWFCGLRLIAPWVYGRLMVDRLEKKDRAAVPKFVAVLREFDEIQRRTPHPEPLVLDQGLNTLTAVHPESEGPLTSSRLGPHARASQVELMLGEFPARRSSIWRASGIAILMRRPDGVKRRASTIVRRVGFRVRKLPKRTRKRLAFLAGALTRRANRLASPLRRSGRLRSRTSVRFPWR